MILKFPMKDDKHPFQIIKDLARVILLNAQGSSSPRGCKYSLFVIEENQSYEESSLPASRCESPLKNKELEKFQPAVSHAILVNPLEYYEDFKSLFLELSFLINEKDKRSLKNLNEKIKEKANENNLGRVLGAFCAWQQEGSSPHVNALHNPYSKYFSLTSEDKRRRELIIQCYLYLLALEKVHFDYLGLVDDPILKKLFSQGIVLMGLVQIYFRNEPQVLDFVYHMGIPLGVQYDNSLLNLHRGKDFSYMRPIRNWTADINLFRLGTARFRRFLLSIQNFNYFQDLNWWVLIVDPYIRFGMSIINLIYFIPRVLSHILVFIKHLFMESWMSPLEKDLSISQRFQIQWNRRWEALFRDALWLINGILNFYVLLDAWGAWSLPINAFIQFIEVLLNVYLYQQFLIQKNESIQYFKENAFLNVEVEFAKERKLFLSELKYRLLLEEKSVYMRMINSILVLISNVLVCASVAAISLYLPLLGSILGVLLTTIQWVSRFSWEEEKNALKEPFELPKIYPKETPLKALAKKTQQGVSASKMNLGYN